MATNRVKAALEKTDTAKPSKGLAPRKLEKLTGDDSMKKEGQFVYDTQKMATEDGFSNVSKAGLDKMKSYDWAFNQLTASKRVTRDIRVTLREMKPTLNDDGMFILRHESGDYVPTEYAWSKIMGLVSLPTHFAREFTATWYDSTGRGRGSERNEHKAGRFEFETLAKIVKHRFDQMSPDKKYLFRLNDKDHSVRVVLSDEYFVINNSCVLELIKEIVPDGRIAHWRGDEDTFYADVIMPDKIISEKDSDFGGMLDFGNSEIGTRKVNCTPALYRSICMNLNIWGKRSGEGIRQVHKGKLNLMELRKEVVDTIMQQIPLVMDMVPILLGTKDMKMDGGLTAKPVYAQIAYDYGLDRKQATECLTGYRMESSVTPDYRNSLYNIINGLTRAAQECEPADWHAMNTISGELATMGADGWERLTGRAKRLKTEKVEAAFATVN